MSDIVTPRAQAVDPLAGAVAAALADCETALTLGTGHAAAALESLRQHADRLAAAGLPALAPPLQRAAGGALGDLVVARSALESAALRLWSLGAPRVLTPAPPASTTLRLRLVVRQPDATWFAIGARGVGALLRGVAAGAPLATHAVELGRRQTTRWLAGTTLGVYDVAAATAVEGRGKAVDWTKALAAVTAGATAVDLGEGLTLGLLDAGWALPLLVPDAVLPTRAGPVPVLTWASDRGTDVVVARAGRQGPEPLLPPR